MSENSFYYRPPIARLADTPLRDHLLRGVVDFREELTRVGIMSGYFVGRRA